MSRRSLPPSLIVTLMAMAVVGAQTCQADAPSAAGAAVHRLMEAVRANDRDAFRDMAVDDYDYSGQKKEDLNPNRDLGLVHDRLVYQLAQLQQVESGVVTAIVDTEITGRVGGETDNPETVVGTCRLWFEVRSQPGGQWRLSAWRPVRIRYASDDWPFGFSVALEITVNNRLSVQVPPGASPMVSGRSSYGLPSEGLYRLRQWLGFGDFATTLFSAVGEVNEDNSGYERLVDERWFMSLKAPEKPGRYYVDAYLSFSAPRPSGGRYVASDDMTIPVVVK
jgi:hypothetical protein